MKLKKVKDGKETTYDIEASLDKLSGIAAFSNIAVGTTTIAADNEKDTLTIAAGSNIILTPDATNDKITIASTNTPTFTNLTTTNLTTANLTTKGEVEIYGTTQTPQTHIDFHYNNSTKDYTSRIIENSEGAIEILAPKGLKLNGSNLKYDDTAIKNRLTAIEKDDTAIKNRLTAIEKSENVTLTADTKRIQNVKYMAKYFPLLGIVFARIQGNIIYSMTAGKGYTLFSIGSHVPDSNAALSVKVGTKDDTAITRKAAAYAKTTGGINIQPLDGDLKGYDVYITGFWFV